jgi:hypothetical protein
MKVVELKPVKSCRGERDIWELELDETAVRLFDERGREVLRMGRDEAVRRIQLPSFLMSIKHIHVYDADQTLYEFLQDKQAMASIQAYLDRALRQDAGARKQLKGGAWAVLILGVVLLLAGGAFLAVEIARGTLLQPGRLRVASPFAGILMGMVFIGWGVAQLVKARHLERDEPAA